MYEWDHIPYDVTHFLLAGFYVGLFVLCCICLIGRCESRCTIGPQAAFYLCMILGTAGRTVFFTFAPFIREGWSFPLTVNMFLNTYPSYCFFTGFSILLALWAEIYRNSSKRVVDTSGGIAIQHFRKPLYLLNILMWAIVLGLYITMMMQTGLKKHNEVAVAETVIMKILFLFCAAVDLVILVGCLIYGMLVWRQFRSVYSTRKLAILKRIAIMTAIIAFIFTIRACLTIWAIFWSLTYTRLYIFDLVYFTLFELIPLCIMLIMLRGIDFGRAFDQFNRRGPLSAAEPAEAEAILPSSSPSFAGFR